MANIKIHRHKLQCNGVPICYDICYEFVQDKNYIYLITAERVNRYLIVDNGLELQETLMIEGFEKIRVENDSIVITSDVSDMFLSKDLKSATCVLKTEEERSINRLLNDTLLFE